MPLPAPYETLRTKRERWANRKYGPSASLAVVYIGRFGAGAEEARKGAERGTKGFIGGGGEGEEGG